jgi:hypothetical protein
MENRIMIFFYSSIFTQRASRRLSSAALLRARNSTLWLRLKCLTYESLRLVQGQLKLWENSDYDIQHQASSIRYFVRFRI